MPCWWVSIKVIVGRSPRAVALTPAHSARSYFLFPAPQSHPIPSPPLIPKQQLAVAVLHRLPNYPQMAIAGPNPPGSQVLQKNPSHMATADKSIACAAAGQ